MNSARFSKSTLRGKGEFINGSRLVYPMEDQAMRSLNILGNKFFSSALSWLLNQRLKDGDFDPFGDFDLLFGAAKLNLKLIDLPIRYRERVYGSTNISRFRHGFLLLRMTLLALRKLKVR